MTLTLATAVVFGMLAWATISDVASRRIPNAIPAIIATVFFIASIAAPDRVDIIGGMWVAVSVFAVCFLGFLAGKVGAGDVKLLAAMALWAGPAAALDFLLITGLAGGALALMYLLPEISYAMTWVRVAAERRAPNLAAVMGAGKNIKEGLPYGVAIAIGGGYVMWSRYLTA